jgi:YD repeat-containing protein
MYLGTFFSAGPGSPVMRDEETQWRVVVAATTTDGTPVLFPQVTGTVVRNLEGGDHPRIVTAEYAYDLFGNVTRERRSTTALNGGDDGLPVSSIAVVTETEYAFNPDSYVVDRVARIVRRDDGGAVLAEVRHYYDGPSFSGLPLGSAGAGLLRRQEEIVLTRADAAALYDAREPDWAALGYHDATRIDGAPAIAVNHTRYDYSAQGTITRRVDAFEGETRFEHDPDGLLVVRMTNAMGHVRTATYDRSWQLIEEHTFANGAAIRYRYDGLGRLRAIIQPDDTSDLPTIRYTPDHSAIPTSM